MRRSPNALVRKNVPTDRVVFYAVFNWRREKNVMKTGKIVKIYASCVLCSNTGSGRVVVPIIIFVFPPRLRRADGNVEKRKGKREK